MKGKGNWFFFFFN